MESKPPLEEPNPKNPYRKPDVGDEVVITGMAGKLPKSRNIYHLRDNLFRKVDMISEDICGWQFAHPEVPKTVGKLYDIEKFDAGCFGATSTQSNSMDPMIRMLLENTYEAITDAGCNLSDIEATRTGIFLGFDFSETEKGVIYEDLTTKAEAIIGTQRSMIAQRLSYYLKVKGPVLTFDTACSSSLYALHQAYVSMREGACDKAIVCGSSLCLYPMISLQFKRLGVLSAEGSCKSFDENSDGYVRSEAVVAVMLEKARDAKRIYAEIVYAKSNCDGFKQEGLTFPSSEAQKTLLREFYDECGIDPTSLTYMEAHGTGTQAGDSQELPIIDSIFCKNRDEPLYIGSIKSNIGHTEPASGLCSIIKVLLNMETDSMLPNIHYKTPRADVKGLAEGRMLVVTERMPLPDQRGLFGVSNYGFGGANSHVLLRWNPKAKTNAGQPKDELPRLICVSSRLEDGVNSILDDYRTRRCDAEFAYLIHQAFKKTVPNHLYKGYGIYNKYGEIKRCLQDVKLERPKLYLVFTNFDKEWLKLGNRLMGMPIFARNIKSIQIMVLKLLGVDISEAIRNLTDVSLINQILGFVAIQISLTQILKELNLVPDRMMGFESGELVAAYLDGHLTLKQTIFVLFYIVSGNLDKINMREEMLNDGCAKYFANNVTTNANESNLKELIPEDAYTLVIGSCPNSLEMENFNLIHPESKDYIVDFFVTLGSLYINGFDMELDKLYPTVELPVSRGTPMLSPLIKWNHSNWKVHLVDNEMNANKKHRAISITSKYEDWSFIVGHIINGRNWFPATGYLFLVWESFAMISGRLFSEMKVVFEDVKYVRATKVPKDGSLELVVMIQTGTHAFEITEGGAVVATGRIYEKTSKHSLLDVSSTPSPNSELIMTEEDVYKELKLRGYGYTGKFRAIRKCCTDLTWGVVEWENNWISFMDCLLQLSMLQRDTRTTFIPTSINQVIIDAPQHLHFVKDMKNMTPVHLYKHLKLVRAGGVEINGLGVSAVARKMEADPVLEISKFIPNDARLEFQDSIRSLIQVVLENSNMSRVKVIEICAIEQDENCLMSAEIHALLKDTPLVQPDVTVLTSKPVCLPGISIRNDLLSTESHCSILVVKNLLETTDISTAVNAIKDVEGFVIARERLGADLSKFSNTPFIVICCHTLETETLVLLRLQVKEVGNTEYLDLSKAMDNLDNWILKLQCMLKEKSNVVLYAQDGELSGILGLVKCLKCESYGSRISCILIMDKAPKFDPKLPFYKDQLEKNMAINIWKDGSWGTYRHLVMPQGNSVENEHCYVNVTTRGDLSTLTWLEGNLSPDDSIPFAEDSIYIYYSALNFRDLMTASGKVSADAITTDRMEQECVQGFEFVGRNSKGQRVMGVGTNGALGTFIKAKNTLPIPDHWTMEDAATVMVTYGTVVDVLLRKFEVKLGQSILIHSGTGGVGLAAINLCLHFGLTVFVTVGTREKHDFLRKYYPQIEEHHIGNSRDTSFEEMIHKYTNGRGVDYVLNSLAEEKLLASIRCLAKGGKFLEIGRFDLSSNNALGLYLLEREAELIGMALDISLKYDHVEHLRKMEDLINKGAIKPLPRTVFEINEVEKAFRYMGIGEHIGKVLIKIREEELAEVHSVPRKLFKGVPRFYCKPECSYIIYGGLGGFGLELADLLVIRGAKKLVLTSRSGVCNGYQRYRIRNWENYGVTVFTTTRDASTEDGCMELLNVANALGPVDGIFNLAGVLSDALFENHTVESFKLALPSKVHCTINFDRISKKLCPSLRYFVVFSSISCGRGNIGQTNYGMANSVMERICEKRKKEGYPALAIQWGAIGEVGMTARMQRDDCELVVDGTLPQRISSCLQVMDKFLRQDEAIVVSMVVAEEKSVDKAASLFDEIISIIGITNVNSINMHVTFPELGMDSMTAVEIKQALERVYDVFFTAQDIKNMTLAKLKELSSAQDALANVDTPVNQNILPMDVQLLLLRYVANKEFSNLPIINMRTMLAEENMDNSPHIVLLPGIDGLAHSLVPLCNKLKARVSCVQYCIDNKVESLTELVKRLLPHIEACETGDLIILAYSFGTAVAIEILTKLESKGRKAKVIFIDGSPDWIAGMVHTCFPAKDEKLFHTLLLSTIMADYMPYEGILKHQETLMKLGTYNERIEYLISVGSKVDISSKHMAYICTSCERLKGLSEYKIREEKLKSEVTLLKAKYPPAWHVTADYGLSKIFQSDVEVFAVEGNHATILENEDLATKINRIILDN